MTDRRHPASDSELRGTDPEVLDLFRRLETDPSARERLAVAFQPLVEYLARRFAGRGEAVEDLVQVANIGLLNAIDRFDPDREVQFSTYATATIVGELKRHFRDKAWAVRVPRQLQETAVHMNKALPELTQELGRSPTIAEIANRLQVEEDDVVGAMDAVQAYSTASLDAPTGPSGITHVETLGEDDSSLDLLESWATIAPAVRELSDRDRRVLYLRFFRDMTQSEIAEEIGSSQMHVSRILNRTLERLRDSAQGEEP
jgi:RNA polymerase sigma-B factor